MLVPEDIDKTISGNTEGAILAGRYRVVRQLGAGGMGSVWLAEDTQLDNKRFAIKMLPSILVSNKRAYRQLKDEALVAMRLVHPNIVQIRAFEENNGNPFLVMDYIEGQTLDDYLAEHWDVSRRDAEAQRGRAGAPRPPLGGLPESDVVRILKPIAAALDYAHGEGVVHRDVKPANVMIRKDGHPYILDFGIAREIQETMTRVTGKLSSGTLLYMSPEQLRGQPPKAAQDVYSFAAMAYECLKGEPPFSRGQIEYQILNEKPTPLPYGVKLSASIMRGLSKEPRHRPDACVGVLTAVSTIRPSTQVRAQAYTPPTRMTPPTVAKPQVSRKSNIAGIVIPIVCILAALVLLGGVMWYRSVQRHEEARKRAVAAQQEEAARLQQEEEKRQAQEAARNKAQEEQLAKQKKAKEDRKVEAEALRLEEEEKSRERELSRQKEEEARRKAEEDVKRREEEKQARERELARKKEEVRKAAEAEKAAIAAREKAESDKAMSLQNARSALAVLANDPWRYESVSMDLTQEQRNVLLPLYQELLCDEAERKALNARFTTDHPDIVMNRKTLENRIGSFKATVQTLVDKLDGRKELPPTLQVVATVDGEEIEGAVLNDGKKDFVLPVKWALRKGKMYGPYRVSCERDGSQYEGTFEQTSAEWNGIKKTNVVLTKVAAAKNVMEVDMDGNAVMRRLLVGRWSGTTRRVDKLKSNSILAFGGGNEWSRRCDYSWIFQDDGTISQSCRMSETVDANNPDIKIGRSSVVQSGTWTLFDEGTVVEVHITAGLYTGKTFRYKLIKHPGNRIEFKTEDDSLKNLCPIANAINERHWYDNDGNYHYEGVCKTSNVRSIVSETPRVFAKVQ